MIYKTQYDDRRRFDNLKETGMGYQIIAANIKNKSERNFYIVYNSEFIIDIDNDFDVFKYRAFEIKGVQLSLEQANTLELDLNSINVLSKSLVKNYIELYSDKSKNYLNTKSSNKGRHYGEKGAIDSLIENASGSEIFTRLSAFENDRRIDFENKCLKGGSFTTTYFDYRTCVNFDDDPVDRYALPNDEAIKFVFTIIPEKIDKLQRGVVQPAFGKLGGGLEAYFDKGTSIGTYKGKSRYGDL